MRKLSLALLVVGSSLHAQIPNGYYSSAEGLDGQSLWTELSEIIRNPNTVSYSQVDEKFVELRTDEDPNNASNIIYFYTQDSRPSSGFTGNGNGSESTGGWNKEHVWPRSRGVGDSGDDQQDMHMLRPTDVDVNSRRAALDFGLVNGNNTSNSNFFEPHDDIKGDVARILFYMVTCYKSSLNLVENVTNSSDQMGNLSLMIQWHKDDPVSDFERERHEIVYDYQGNRNPFIDHPEWVNCIWGDACEGGSNEPLNTESSTEVKFYPNPVEGVLKVENLPKGYTVRIFDGVGRRMPVRKSLTGIDVSDFEPGQYFFTISTNPPQFFKFLVR